MHAFLLYFISVDLQCSRSEVYDSSIMTKQTDHCCRRQYDTKAWNKSNSMNKIPFLSNQSAFYIKFFVFLYEQTLNTALQITGVWSVTICQNRERFEHNNVVYVLYLHLYLLTPRRIFITELLFCIFMQFLICTLLLVFSIVFGYNVGTGNRTTKKKTTSIQIGNKMRQR